MLSPIDPATYEEMWEGRKKMYVHEVNDPARINHMYFVVSDLLDSFSNNSRHQDGLWAGLSPKTVEDCKHWKTILKMIEAKASVMNVNIKQRKQHPNSRPSKRYGD